MNETRKDLERAIIGNLLVERGDEDRRHPAQIALDKGVRSTWFERDEYAAIFTIIERRVNDRTINEYDGYAIVTEAADLQNDKSYKYRSLGDLVIDPMKVLEEASEGAANPGYLEWYISRLRAHATLSIFSKVCKDAVKKWIADPITALAIVKEGLSSVSLMADGESGVDKIDQCIADLEAAEEEAWHMRVDPDGPRDLNWIPGYKVMFSPLTRLYLGLSKRFHVIAARPSVGKTMLAVNLVRFWIDQGLKVMINSLDMPSEDMVDRSRTEKSRVSIAKKRYTPTLADLSELRKASEWIRASKTVVGEIPYVEDLIQKISARAAAGEIDIVVVDYLQLLQSYTLDNSDEYRRVSYVAERLKQAANALKVPIVCLAQLNRKGEGREGEEPKLSDLRGSGAIEQAASTILFLHRDMTVVQKWQTNPPYWFYENQDYGRKHAAENIDPIWLILAKNQNGPTGKLPIVVNKPYFCAKLGDYNARPISRQEGVGATKREVNDWSLAFSRFHQDWRHDTWEQSLLKDNRTPFMPDDRDARIVLEEPAF